MAVQVHFVGIGDGMVAAVVRLQSDAEGLLQAGRKLVKMD